MADGWMVLLPVAMSIALVHTLAGPDHYLPFIAMAKARRWSTGRALGVTAVCGLGHIASSVVLALAGSALALGARRLAAIESLRGDIAAWGLIAFGLAYTVWGLRQAYRNRPHAHVHTHADGTTHVHQHTHHREHVHPHAATRPVTPWVLFVIFLLGPCEPLIPLLMYPAVERSLLGFVVVAGLFAVITVAAMAAAVWVGLRGLRVVRLPGIERYATAIAGLAVLGCGLAIRFLGL